MCGGELSHLCTETLLGVHWTALAHSPARYSVHCTPAHSGIPTVSASQVDPSLGLYVCQGLAPGSFYTVEVTSEKPGWPSESAPTVDQLTSEWVSDSLVRWLSTPKGSERHSRGGRRDQHGHAIFVNIVMLLYL